MEIKTQPTRLERLLILRQQIIDLINDGIDISKTLDDVDDEIKKEYLTPSDKKADQ